MSDDKSLVGQPDRIRVSAQENYEVQYLADKFDLPMPVVRKVVVEHGPMRKKVEAALRKVKAAK